MPRQGPECAAANAIAEVTNRDLGPLAQLPVPDDNQLG